MLRESSLLVDLEEHFVRADGGSYCLYGDPAYPLSRFLLSPFKGAQIAAGRKEWNKRMSRVRQPVEWGFGDVVNTFAFLDFKKNHKIHLQAVAKAYAVGVILVNCYNTLYRNRTAQFFDLYPPSLENYLKINEEI